MKRIGNREGRRFVNLDEARGIDRPRYKSYRGRPYRVAPLPYLDALDLQAVIVRLGNQDDTDEQRAAYTEAVALMGRLARPVGWRRLVQWRNPFRLATEVEIVEWMDFFWKCRTGLSLVEFAAAVESRRST